MSLLSTLISRVTGLTNAINSIAIKAKLIPELPVATTPASAGDLMAISQGGVMKKIPFSDVGTAGGIAKIQFGVAGGNAVIFGATGNVLATLQSGDIVQGWWSASEFWIASRYNGGSIASKGSYTILAPIEDL